MSIFVQTSHYAKEGKQELHKRAMAAMGDSAYKKATTEYKQHCGLWSTAAELLADQVATALTAAEQNTSTNASAVALDDSPWLQSAAAAARSQYLKVLAKKRLTASLQQPKPDKEHEDRGNKIRKITQAAAEKLQAETAQKETKAAEKRHELIRLATVEFSRREYGKKHKAGPDILWERPEKACHCHLTLGRGVHKDRCDFNRVCLRRLLRHNEIDRGHI